MEQYLYSDLPAASKSKARAVCEFYNICEVCPMQNSCNTWFTLIEIEEVYEKMIKMIDSAEEDLMSLFSRGE